MGMIDTSTISGKVEWMLYHRPETRNSDKRLIIELWRTFFEHRLQRDTEGNLSFVALEVVMELPSPESIRRCRQKFQEGPCKTCHGMKEYRKTWDAELEKCTACHATGLGGKYPPTEWSIIERRSREKAVRKTIKTESFDEHLP